MAHASVFPADAQWIWLPGFDDAAASGQFVLFRKIFTLQALPSEPVPLHVSADTRYRLYLNGQSISFGPCKSYATHWNYETVDVRPHLSLGQNVLAARVLRFSSSHPGCLSMTRTPLAGFVLYLDVAGHVVRTDTTWKTARDESARLADESEWDYRLGPQFLGLTERVDGRRSPRGWLAASYDDSQWPTAVRSTAVRKISPALDPWRLYPREIPALTETFSRFHSAVVSSGSISTDQWTRLFRGKAPLHLVADSAYSVDIQTEVLTTGFIDFACTLLEPDPEGPLVEILTSECYESPMESGRPRSKGNRTDHENGQLYGITDTYIPHDGANHYSPFWWRTFRYIRLSITVRSSPLVVEAFTYRATHYPLRVNTTVQTTNAMAQKLWDISLNTLKNCMHETYEDCPFYEQNQFAMDARTQMLITYVISCDDRLARKTMREFFASRRDDGLVETHFPSPGRLLTIPTFSLFWVLMVHDHMVHFGDERLVRRYIGAVDGVLGYFDERINDLGLVGQFDQDCWPFVDWVDGWAMPSRRFTGLAVPPAYYERGAATYNSLLYAYVLLRAKELCSFIGRHDTADEYAGRHRRLVDAVRSSCYDTRSGFFLDGPGATAAQLSQHSQIFGVLAECVIGDDARRLMQRTVLQREAFGLAKASLAMTFYTFRAVSKVGIYAQCWNTLIQPWKTMIAQNMTTWAESESMVRSDCHGWSAVPLYEMAAEIFGLQHHSDEYLARVAQAGTKMSVRASKQAKTGAVSACIDLGQEFSGVTLSYSSETSCFRQVR